VGLVHPDGSAGEGSDAARGAGRRAE